MDRWTLALEAVPGSLAAVRVDEQDHRPVDVELVDGDAGELGRSFAALACAEGGHPDHVVMVVPGDLDVERFATLTEAVGLAGLPEPSWLPDAVAWAGAQLTGWVAGTRALVVDARGDDLVAWSVCTADDGVAIAQGGALDLGGRLDTLLGGVVRAKLAVVAPELADALRGRVDAAARRDAAHLDRELREARRLLCRADDEELVVSAGETEVYLDRDEFTQLADHALHDVVVEALGQEAPHLPMVVVADRPTAIVEHLAPRATVVRAPENESSLAGAAALVLPRPADDLDDPTPTDGIPRTVLPFPAPASTPPATPRGGDVVPAPRARRRPAARSRVRT
ncbi:hypothetical protein [Actinomycetospora cinnamomea]|uniref:Hsp70 protein n=1 Tax=Actinomycetospora cinnamomea TaxID=663609 RepID=A0A2U1FFU8_9PSEU|nr:hypothetical protein [Actinomycetospora cinnamomea]PVZ11085.1 hypothetical protein C8D89_104299 [Actinomycetospora cinnamomea]